MTIWKHIKKDGVPKKFHTFMFANGLIYRITDKDNFPYKDPPSNYYAYWNDVVNYIHKNDNPYKLHTNSTG